MLTIGQCIQHYNDLFYTVSSKKCNIKLRKETTANKITCTIERPVTLHVMLYTGKGNTLSLQAYTETPRNCAPPPKKIKESDITKVQTPPVQSNS